MKTSTASCTSFTMEVAMLEEEKVSGREEKVSEMGFCGLAMVYTLTAWFELARLISFN